MPSIEIGAGENPCPGIDVHTDIMALPHIECVCPMDKIPYPDGYFDRLRANDVLEHQSWELVPATLREWARILSPGAAVFIQVPDGDELIGRYVKGLIDLRTLNYYLMGGHSDREAHKGTDEKGVPRWFWNAHHVVFNLAWLAGLLKEAGLEPFQVEKNPATWTNVAVWCRRV